ncbi:hypothetical protein SAMN05443287_109122 [Micromonospora phaseoli]|uniref:Uncharacterized protein n=1 Tax=Micromonospora phaseoli TaxID=1144548 RepID=A0A1H7CF27_9ACTN|nr:hypothetical protein [Micromonospora phaseoli]PZV97867.1 hypothetical protein CLV64_105132 [Micromonospora phaseoli]GIJ78533.1 hypothetical protein Xph01_29650 [Micromonospora phaseoli]SEJ88076.1 hypothetical protein SAMN05443287_109122 [Micromonospora phaseoli]
MSTGREVIDLDEQNHQSTAAGSVVPDRLLARRKMGVRLVAAFVVGAVLGGFGVHELRDSQEERERNASVALVAFPVSIAGGGSDVDGVLQLDGQLAVTNAGQAPITVRAATGQAPGALVSDTGRSRLLRPGGTDVIDVKLRLECATAFGGELLSMRFSVETGDHQVREIDYPVALVGSSWHAEQPCAHFRAKEKRGG